MKKSKVLILSTIVDALIGTEVAIVCGYVALKLILMLLGTYDQSDQGGLGLLFLWVPSAGIVLVVFFLIIAYALIAFELITAWISFKTNKKSWTIVHIIMLIVVSFIGLFFSAFRPQIVSTFISNWFVFAAVLRIVGYFSQKKLETITLDSRGNIGGKQK